ncbi:MAG TPA: hypothetical protein VGK89_05065 [Candidatus Eisenbacteria bacterium]
MTKRHASTSPRAAARPAATPAPLAAAPATLFPALREILDPSAPFLVPLLLLLVGRWVLWLHLPFASEDAYITFRYARDLAGGMGPVYNPGERVMGFTSAPWMLWSAAGYALLKDPVLWSRIWTLIGDVTTLLVMGTMLRGTASLASAWCFNFFFAAWPFIAAVGVSGMENSAMFTLIALAGALVARSSPASGPVLGLLALWRPEGLASAAVIALGARWRDRAIAAAVALAGLGALALIYGSPIPQSLFAKARIYGTAGPWLGRHWWEWLSPFAFGRWPIASEGNSLLPLTVVFAPALVAGAPHLWRARRSGLALAVAGALVVWLGYSLLGVTYFYWYMLVPLAGLAALAAVGLPRIARGPYLYVSIALFVLGTWTLTPVLYLGRAKAEYFSFGAVAQYLLAHAQPGEKVMLEPIGFIGYHNPLRIVDEIGLVSPQVATRRLQGPGWYADIEERERPDWLVVRRTFLTSGEAFAGAGAPFRNPAERDSVLGRFRTVTGTAEEAGDLSMVVLRRVR